MEVDDLVKEKCSSFFCVCIKQKGRREKRERIHGQPINKFLNVVSVYFFGYDCEGEIQLIREQGNWRKKQSIMIYEIKTEKRNQLKQRRERDCSERIKNRSKWRLR